MSRNIFTYSRTCFFSKSGGAFIVNRKNKQWPFYLRDYFLKNYKTFYLMGYGFAPCEGFSNKNISDERFKIRKSKFYKNTEKAIFIK